MPDVATSIARALNDKVSAATTRTARGIVVAVSVDGFVTFTVGSLTTPRKGVLVGAGVPQVGEVITYLDEGRGIPLVFGATGVRDLYLGALNKLQVGTTVLDAAGVSVGGVAQQAGSWTVLGLLNGWANFGAGYAPAAYRRAGDVVSLRGLVAGGTIGGVGVGTAIFTLPAGFRPVSPKVFATIAGNTLGRLNINADGNVYCEIGTNTFVSLDGVAFSTS